MTKTEKETMARTVRCPKCRAQAYMNCVRHKGIHPVSLAHPHAERIALALGETATEGVPT
jgi:hypothetical protein